MQTLDEIKALALAARQRGDLAAEEEALKQYLARRDMTSAPEAALIGAGKAFTDVWEGAKQLVGLGRTEADRAEAERLYAPLKADYPIATTLGETAPYLAAGGLAGGGRTLAQAALRQGLAGAGVGGLMEGAAQDRAQRAAVEGATGAAGGALFGLPGAAARQALRPEVTMLREAGVVPTVGQTLGGMASRLEEAAGSVPVVGHMIDFARQRARDEFNVGALNRALAPIGGQADVAGHTGIGAAQQLVNDAYMAARDLAPGGLPLDQTARREIGVLRQFLGRATQDTERDFDRFYQGTFQRHLGGAAGFETRSFKELDAELGRKIRASNNNEQLKRAFEELQRILRDSAGRANPAYREAQRAADTSAAMLMRAENAANRAANTEGVFTPGQLNLAVRQMDTTARRRASARGDALMQPYASAGQTVLGDRVANSGTPVRLLTSGGLLGAGAYLEPGTLAAALAALVGAARPVQQGMNAAMRGGQYVPPALGQLLQN